MGMTDRLTAFFDEMEKIAVSTRLSSFMQTRAGRRPIRVHNVLSKERAFRTPPEEKTLATEADLESVKDYEVEGGAGAEEIGSAGKTAAMAGDLRVKTPGVNLTNPPTEDSKQVAFKQLSNSMKPGKFVNQTKPKNLVGPGPSIKQIATLPTG
jgi:hypothetical protein